MVRTRTASLLLAALLLGCPEPERPPEPPHVLYDVDAQSLDNPFPDARLLTEEGLVLRPDWYRPFLMPKALTAKMAAFLATYTETAKELRGVGNFGETLLRVSAPVDPATLSGKAARLRKGGDGWHVLEANVTLEHSTAALIDTGKTAGEGFPEFLIARPTVPLPEGEEGLLVLKRGIATVDGMALGRGYGWDDEPGNRELATAAAEALGVGEEEILIALRLKAAPVTPKLQALAQWTTANTPVFSIPAKGLVPEGNMQRFVGTWTRGEADWDKLTPHLTRWPWSNPASNVGQVIVGTFKARDLQQAGVWQPQWVENPSGAPEVDQNFVLTLPVGAKPQGGYKVVLGAHGLNGRNLPQLNGSTSFCLEVAQVLAARGLGCLGIDAPAHGARGNSLDFFAVDDLRKIRDNFRQMTFDQLQLSRLAQVLDVDGDGQPDLSGELGYFGNSLGGIMGGSFAAVDPRLKYGVLNVPGGGLATILASVDIRDKVGLLLVAKTGLTFGSLEYYQLFPLFRTVGQLFIEEGDPVNVGLAFRSTERALLIQQGLNDVVVPNLTTANLAEAMGVPKADAGITGASPVRAYTSIDPVRFGKPANFNGHNVFWEIEAARTQALTFLGTGGTQLVVE